MDFIYNIIAGFIGGYILIWISSRFHACYFVEDWAVKNGWPAAHATILLPIHTPDLGQTRKQRLCRLTARDRSGKFRHGWVAVSPCILGIIFAKRVDVIKVDEEV